jgi:hypothetical protein
MKQILLAAMILIIGTRVYAQTQPMKTLPEVEKMTTTIINDFNQGDVLAALKKLKPYWPMPTEQFDNMVKETTGQLNQIAPQVGKTIEVKRYKKQQISDFLYREIIFHKFKNQVIYWVFDFYKPEAEWQVTSVTYSNNLDRLYDDIK